MKQHEFLYMIGIRKIIGILACFIFPTSTLCADYFTENGINYQVISSSDKTVRVGYHIKNGNSTTIGTALSNVNTTGTITIPMSVRGYTPIEIDGSAFANRNISEIIIPSTIVSIKDHAFSNCTYLNKVTLPSSITEIGQYAFSDCTNLKEITIPESVSKLEWGVFRNCTSLTDIHLPETLKEINSYAFYACTSLQKISFPRALEKIQNNAFQATSLVQIVIPQSIKYLSLSFENCRTLVSVTIEENINNLWQMMTAFRNCKSLKHIYSKDKLNNFSSYSENFGDISSDARLYVPLGTKSKYLSTTGWKSVAHTAEVRGDVIFVLNNHSDSNEVIEYMVVNSDKREVQLGAETFNAISSDQTSFDIPSTIIQGEEYKVVAIGDNAFLNCSSLESIRIPSSVCQISSAFLGCTNLRSVYIDNRHPSEIETNANCFEGIPDDAILYVPAGTKRKYEEIESWNIFSQIIEVSPISLGETSTTVGSNAHLPIVLNSNEEISGLQFGITLPEGFSVVEQDGEAKVSLTDRTKGMSVMSRKDPEAENSYLFVLFSLDGKPITGTEGAILNVSIKCGSNVEIGKYIPQIKDIYMVTSAFETLNPAESESELTINDYLFGDVNNEGSITAQDASLVQQLVAGKISSTTDGIVSDAADVNGDGEVTAQDASLIQQHVAGKIDISTINH